MNQRVADTIKLLKDLVLLFCGDADPVVLDLKIDVPVAAIKMDTEVLPARRILHRIVHQVEQRTGNRFTIYGKRRKIVIDFLLEFKSVLLDLKTIRFECASHQVGYIGFAKAVLLLACLDAAEVKNVVDQ